LLGFPILQPVLFHFHRTDAFVSQLFFSCLLPHGFPKSHSMRIVTRYRDHIDECIGLMSQIEHSAASQATLPGSCPIRFHRVAAFGQ